MNHKALILSTKFALAGLALSVMPGCKLLDNFKGFFGGKKAAYGSSVEGVEDDSPAVISINGKKVMSRDMFEKNLDRAIKAMLFGCPLKKLPNVA